MAKYQSPELYPSPKEHTPIASNTAPQQQFAPIYMEKPSFDSFSLLQHNLQNCLDIIDNEVMKNYVSFLDSCDVLPVDSSEIDSLEQIQFFQITELVYEENEFSVHKLATVYNALSNKPCTLVLMIKSDGKDNQFYMGVRSRDPQFSTGTMRQLFEQSLLGLFPGSVTTDYYNENLKTDLSDFQVGCVSSVTCIADYKQGKNTFDNKDFIQGLEKFIYSMVGKPYAVDPEIVRLVCVCLMIRVCLSVTWERDQVEVVIREKDGCRKDPVRDPVPVHSVILDADLLVLQDTVHKLPEIVLYTFAVVMDLRIVVQFLADQLIQLLPIHRCGEPPQLVDKGQKLHFGKRTGTDDDLDHGKQFLARQKVIQNQMVAFFAVGVLQLRVSDELTML